MEERDENGLEGMAWGSKGGEEDKIQQTLFVIDFSS